MLLRCTKRINPKRVINSAIALIIITSSIAGAVITAPVAVFALSAGGIQSTIASIIISLMLQCGTAPVNTNYLNALNASYGYTIETAISEGLLTETANGLVDSGLASAIEGAAAYSDLGLGDIFTTTAADGAGVIASSGAVNIANTAIHVGTAGTIGAFAGAVAVGVGAGVLINHIRENIGILIKYGLPMGAEDFKDLVQNAPAGYDKCYYSQRKDNVQVTSYLCFYDSTEIAAYGFYSNNNLMGNVYTKTGDVFRGNAKRVLYRNSTFESVIDYNASNGPTSVPRDRIVGQNYDRIFDNVTDMENYVNGLKNNNQELPSKPVVSPDIIGPLGNQYYDQNNNSYPGLVNQIPEGSDMKPVDMNDYQDFVDNANNNTENGDTGENTQGQDFDDFIDPYIVDAPTIPDEPIIPDQPVDIPEVPDRPVVPEQPTIPDKPNIDQETLDKALEGATTVDLRAIFPFCIPFDLYNLLLIFDTGENRKAPHITFTFPLTDWVIDVDLAPFDPVAGILRLLELILFIIGLAVATRSLIGAGGS